MQAPQPPPNFGFKNTPPRPMNPADWSKPNAADRNFKEPPAFAPMKNQPGRPRVDVISLFLFFIVITLGFTQETNWLLRMTTQRAILAETEKAQAELSFLKAQVNPHFLFNTLNNIYTLAIIKDDNTAPSIMKLSKIMRYITDEAGHDFVDLKNEIDCISNFIALQQLRLTQKTMLVYELKGSFENKKIAPLILMAFVENIFKYGISNHQKSTLIIKLNTQERFINLYCQNTIFPEKKNTERTGIGLENTKQRLKYIYPDRHMLSINNSDGFFTVNLSIHC
ncbi:histidine kinase [Pedobacter sp. MW01-1-1]|uniref:histidine kinase n=1 Tax=Pedobacter sp. MW01-1-1 TaxID=3383027 RepID=UPI003FEEA23D